MDLFVLRNLVRDGKFFGVKFVKRTDGKIRVMNARYGVTQGVKGVGAPYDFESHNLLPVYDTRKRAFRCIPAESILELRVHGKRIV